MEGVVVFFILILDIVIFRYFFWEYGIIVCFLGKGLFLGSLFVNVNMLFVGDVLIGYKVVMGF